jgi:hypothetical protein
MDEDTKHIIAELKELVSDLENGLQPSNIVLLEAVERVIRSTRGKTYSA